MTFSTFRLSEKGCREYFFHGDICLHEHVAHTPDEELSFNLGSSESTSYFEFFQVEGIAFQSVIPLQHLTAKSYNM